MSAKIPDTLEILPEELEGETGILVGQSGVGKSSIINQLVPGAQIATATLSNATLEGTHTTTASVMHRLPGGGRLIDSPGVRDFIPTIDDPRSTQNLSSAGDGYPWPDGKTFKAIAFKPNFLQCSNSAMASSKLVMGITPTPIRRS